MRRELTSTQILIKFSPKERLGFCKLRLARLILCKYYWVVDSQHFYVENHSTNLERKFSDILLYLIFNIKCLYSSNKTNILVFLLQFEWTLPVLTKVRYVRYLTLAKYVDHTWHFLSKLFDWWWYDDGDGDMVTLEDEYWLSVRVQQSLVQRDEQHEAEEEAGRREEVPDTIWLIWIKMLKLMI